MQVTTQLTPLTAEITGRPVTISGSRLYDGTTTADNSILTITSGVSGENLTLTGSGILEQKRWDSDNNKQ